jgi:phage baseplate assembly protein W
VSELFGTGLKHPLEATSAGRFARSSGVERIFESIEHLLNTPRGTYPLDPEYGVDLAAYDPIAQPEAVAWRVADAIDRSEPRIEELEVGIVRADPGEGRLDLDVRFVPVGSNNEYNRIYPLYRRA